MHSDSRKDMKRKALVVTSSHDGGKKDACAEDLNQGKASLSHNASKGKKGFSHKDSGKPQKPNHKGTGVNKVVNSTTLGWEKSKWPPFTPPQTNPTFSFGTGSSRNDFTNREIGDIPQRESYAGREVNHQGDSTRSNRDKGMINQVPSTNLRVVRESILATPLRKIADYFGGELAGAGDYVEEDLAGEAHRDGSHGEFV
nr:hypothetical protein CFP56_03510 [Quercus suber]